MKNKMRKLTVKGMVFIASFLVGMFIAKATKAQQNDPTLLYQISGKNLSQPSFLYGTIHVICPDDLVISDATKKALDESEQLVLELDMDDPQFMTKAQQLAMNEGMKNISSEFSEDELAAVNAFFKANYGADMSQLGVLKPIGLLGMIYPKGLDCAQPGSFEGSFMQLKGDKELLGLETLEYQMGIFDQIPLEDQVDWLVEYTKDVEKLKSEIGELVEIYKKEDVEQLHDFVANSPEFEEYADLMLYKRNKEWIPKIEKLVKEKPTFIAVGAGHLGSDQGVIALLRKAGYSVTAVN